MADLLPRVIRPWIPRRRPSPSSTVFLEVGPWLPGLHWRPHTGARHLAGGCESGGSNPPQVPTLPCVATTRPMTYSPPLLHARPHPHAFQAQHPLHWQQRLQHRAAVMHTPSAAGEFELLERMLGLRHLSVLRAMREYGWGINCRFKCFEGTGEEREYGGKARSVSLSLFSGFFTEAVEGGAVSL
jgi:hypothetical protein